MLGVLVHGVPGRRSLISMLGAGLTTLLLSGCPPPEMPLIGDFTSEVVQLDSCRLIGADERERCVRDEIITTKRVTLLEDDFERVWIIGLTLEGENDRRVLGTRDSQGGFIFEDRARTDNAENGCRLETSLLISVQIDASADPEMIGLDPCIPLVGRETRRVVTSTGCDGLNDPPQRIERISRKRWDRSPTCGMTTP